MLFVSSALEYARMRDWVMEFRSGGFGGSTALWVGDGVYDRRSCFPPCLRFEAQQSSILA